MKRWKKAILGVSFLVLTAAAVAWALPPNEVDTLYFSDAEFNNNIGERILFCDGTHYNWGSTSSPHRATLSSPCTNPNGYVICYVNGVQSSCPAGICSYGGNWC